MPCPPPSSSTSRAAGRRLRGKAVAKNRAGAKAAKVVATKTKKSPGASLKIVQSRVGPTRILRPDEKLASEAGISIHLPPFERFFAGLLRSPPSEFVTTTNESYSSASYSHSKSSKHCWKTICQRLQLPFPPLTTETNQTNIPSYVACPKLHFGIRAALVMEEARFALANGLSRTLRKINNKNSSSSSNNNNDDDDVFCVDLVGCQTRDKSKASSSVLTFSNTNGKKRPFTPDQIQTLRKGTVMACIPAGGATTVSLNTIRLGVVLSTNRDETIRSQTFSIMVFQSLTHKNFRNQSLGKTSSSSSQQWPKQHPNETRVCWRLIPIASLLTEQRQFEACTSPSVISAPFLYSLLGGTRTTAPPAPEESKVMDNQDTPLSKLFHLPQLNTTQEKAAMSFLNSKPNTITLVQGPPGTGKTTLLVAIIGRYVLQSIQDDAARCLMVCAPTNKAVSVLCTRFLDSMPGSKVPCNIILVGDEDKLLHGEGVATSGHRGRAAFEPSSKIRSVFLYTFVPTLLNDFGVLERYLKSTNRTFPPTKTGHPPKNHRCMCSLAQRLEWRLEHGLPGMVTEELQGTLRKITTWFEQQQQQQSLQDVLRWIHNVTLIIKGWKEEQVWSNLLQSAHIVFCTLTSAGASILKKSFGCSSSEVPSTVTTTNSNNRCNNAISDLIVDEAAASTEPELYIPFQFRPRRLLAVGDPKQLPASVSSPLCQKLGLDKSLQERLMYDRNYPYIVLDVQYRMKPTICQFPSNQFYSGKVSNGPNVRRSDYVGPMSLWNGRSYSFVQVHGKERQTLNGSYQNLPEANTVVDLVQRLQQQASHDRIPQWNSPDHIRIVTFYQAQVSLIQRLLHKQRLGGAIVVATVDSSQGCESDVVIVSFVRSPHSHTKNNNRSGKAPTVGFLADDRRMNVAITRAKYQLVCVGNAESMARLSHPKAKTIQSLTLDAFERGCTIRSFRGGREWKSWKLKRLQEATNQTITVESRNKKHKTEENVHGASEVPCTIEGSTTIEGGTDVRAVKSEPDLGVEIESNAGTTKEGDRNSDSDEKSSSSSSSSCSSSSSSSSSDDSSDSESSDTEDIQYRQSGDAAVLNAIST